jgi:hypothetical protein
LEFNLSSKGISQLQPFEDFENEEDDAALTDDEEIFELLLEEDISFLLLEEERLLLLDPSWLLPLWLTKEDDEDFSTFSFAEVPLSPPQATRAMITIIDPISRQRLLPG